MVHFALNQVTKLNGSASLSCPLRFTEERHLWNRQRTVPFPSRSFPQAAQDPLGTRYNLL